MTRLDVFITAATVGGWVLIAAALFTTGWVIARATYWTVRLLRAAAQWQHDTRPPLPHRTPEDVHRDAADYRARRIDEANRRLGRVPAAPDNTQGLRLDWADEAELIWAASKEVDQP